MRWIFDTGIWLNHASHENVRRAVDQVRLRDPEILTSPVSIAEIIGVLTRRGHGNRTAAVVRLVRELSHVPEVPVSVWEDAGAIHAAERARVADLSLSDASILALARTESAWLLTTDAALVKNRSGVKCRHVAVG
jgi:predicted nucleic acid-binding protein